MGRRNQKGTCIFSWLRLNCRMTDKPIEKRVFSQLISRVCFITAGRTNLSNSVPLANGLFGYA